MEATKRLPSFCPIDERRDAAIGRLD